MRWGQILVLMDAFYYYVIIIFRKLISVVLFIALLINTLERMSARETLGKNVVSHTIQNYYNILWCAKYTKYILSSWYVLYPWILYMLHVAYIAFISVCVYFTLTFNTIIRTLTVLFRSSFILNKRNTNFTFL